MVLKALGDTPEEALRPVGRPGAVAMVMVMGITGPGAVGMDADALVDDVVELEVPLMGKGEPVSG